MFLLIFLSQIKYICKVNQLMFYRLSDDIYKIYQAQLPLGNQNKKQANNCLT